MFLAPALDSESQLKLTEIKEKMGSLERVLEEDVAKNKTKASSSFLRAEGNDEEGEENEPILEHEKKLQETPLAIQDAAYEDDADDDVVDLGFKFGKMRYACIGAHLDVADLNLE